MNTRYIKNTIFCTHIFQFKNEPLARKLLDHIQNEHIEGIESNVAPNLKQNLSESKFDLFDRDHKIIQNTKNYIASCIKEVLNDIQNEKFDYHIQFYESWYHICKPNSVHEVHNHANCSWCGVFYLKSGDPDSGGKTMFNSPISSNYGDFGTLHLNEEAISVTAADGKLLLFPSYLRHYQSLYLGTQDRVVVAFNSLILGKYPSKS